MLKAGFAAGTATAMSSTLLGAGRARAAVYTEAFPTSPLILGPASAPNDPFVEELPIPKALRPVTDGSVRLDPDHHDSMGGRPHQVLPSELPAPYDNDPLIYHLKLQIGTHSFTKSRVRPINSLGVGVRPPPGAPVSLAADGTTTLPDSVIYGFSAYDPSVQDFVAAFPGARINAEYGRPCMVRFENNLAANPRLLDRQDFGAPVNGPYEADPDLGGPRFLTHLHNGHTAPESDGQPHYQDAGYAPGQYNDNLYLNYPAGGDDREKQSFLWFHDHQHGHTGANVYKGMVGLFPIYDPVPSPGFPDGKDPGDETKGLRLPGVRTDHGDGTFDVEYDIPMALYDCCLDDGVTVHHDFHTGAPDELHPEWWGKTFFRHFPNHGFVGDIFTVNCKAFPVLEVKRRKYRFRFLGASIARCYELVLMRSSGGPRSAVSLGYTDEELQGQYRIEDGEQCMRMTQIASEGGLLPFPIVRNSIEIWPAKRREFVIDFTRYMDGSPTRKGDVLYLANIMKMDNGRLPNAGTRFGLDPKYKIPLVKIVIGDDAPDNSVMPGPTTQLRAVPDFPVAEWRPLFDKRRIFRLERGGTFGGETEWLINGRQFDPHTPLAFPVQGTYEVWEIQNGGGGWTHPMHIHQEEHRVVLRNGKPVPQASGHPDDVSKEDVVALDPGESVVICREFRTFTGPYVAHCHNLAHEDHNMMFGWTIVPPGDPRADYGKKR